MGGPTSRPFYTSYPGSVFERRQLKQRPVLSIGESFVHQAVEPVFGPSALHRDKEQWFSRFNRDEPERGGAEKTMNLRSKEWLEQTREDWAREANRALEREGRPERIDHRSLREQEIERVPQRHIGVHAMAMEERGVRTERGEEFERIERLNERHSLERGQAHEYQRETKAGQERNHAHERDYDYGRER